MRRFLKRAWQLTRTRILWGYRLHSLGERSVLGSSRLIIGPKSISIGHHTTLADNWRLVDLQLSAKNHKPKILIGSYCSILNEFQCNASLHVEIQDYVLIAPRVFITDSDHIVDEFGEKTTRCKEFRSAPVLIEHNCWLGVNSVILKGVKIGHHATIGANAVVTRDVQPGTTVAGSPARPIGRIKFDTPSGSPAEIS